MKDLINVRNNHGVLVVSSREVAENFEKNHRDILETIRGLTEQMGGAEFSAGYFIESKYQHEQNKQWYPEYLLTRDGFSLLVMGFTGQRALEWKLKYIEAFNKMEEQLKNQVDVRQLSPHLQMFNQLFQALATSELEQKRLREEIKETKEQVITIKDVIAINPKDDWRKKTNLILNKIGGQLGDYKRPKNEAYLELEKRAGCNLEKLLENAIKRAETSGAPKKVINELNYLDVIDNNKRLREIYIAIVKEMAIKYGVKMNKEAM
ncbi:Phage regulatory protein Rha [Caloramator mitchellensis]|uniref:Phage regulatory protein Rha n=1 Tax=Caloramator mitchellensis TaxID=908809 RepID=A0A0R3JSR7_CALMK|nr:Rha family transcriptional regulator [Caloramator mitchellensis]KRQ86026.1 Phage regulatory protein Rha [Caloramator mitchellensis]